MHNQNAVLVPRQSELLHPVHLVTQGAVVRGYAAAALRSSERSRNVAHPCKAKRLLFLIDVGNRGRGTTRFFQGIMNVVEDDGWRFTTAFGEDSFRLPRSISCKRSVTKTVHHHEPRTASVPSNCPPVTTHLLATQRD